MISAKGRPQVLAGTFLLLCCAAFTPVIRSQVKQTPRLDRQSLIETAREIMKTARYCALITLDSNGRPHARTMDPFLPEDNMVVWLGTNARSRKVAEIRRNQRVTLYYFVSDDQAYVTISGRARIVRDATEKVKHWKDEWKDFYPDREKNYLLIAIVPEKLAVISVKLGIVGDTVTWTPPTVRFGSRKPKRF
jgi:general stress protein 26